MAVSALGAFVATSAFAGEWLVGGVPVTVTLAADTEGTVTLENTFLGATTVVDCNGLFEGTIGPLGADTIIDAYDLTPTMAGVLNTADTAKSPLDCEALSGLCSGLANVWVVKLNLQLSEVWNSKIELMTNGEELDILGAESGYEVECTGSLGKQEIECTGAAVDSTLTNEATDVKGVFNKAVSIPCSIGTGKVGGEGLIFDTNGEVTAVS